MQRAEPALSSINSGPAFDARVAFSAFLALVGRHLTGGLGRASCGVVKRYKNMYSLGMKPVAFCGSALDDLRSFPQAAMREAGYQLDKVQHGFAPDDAKAMPSIGAGVTELRIWDEAGTFRVVYVAKLADAVYVLHCFQKKTQQTARRDIELARQRLKALMKELAP